MQVYNYSKETFEYLGESTARENPLEEGKYLIPSYATDIELPETEDNEVAVFDENSQEWSVIPDYRGQIFWDSGRNTHEITEIGEEPEDDWLTEKPPFTEEELAEQFEDKQQEIISQLKTNANAVIEDRFPQYHQINLLDGTKGDIPDGWDNTVRVSDYSVVKEFKQAIITTNNTIEDNITALSYPDSSVDDLEAIGIGQEAIKAEAGY